MEYISVKTAAEQFHISERRIQKLCESGRIPDARMVSDVWLIPKDAQKPADGRMSFSPKDPGLLSLKECCEELSISQATGRNWLKLGKLRPSHIMDGHPVFNREDVEALCYEIREGNNPSLKSRRNKRFLRGNVISRSYLSAGSPNLKSVQSVLDALTPYSAEAPDTAKTYATPLSTPQICAILSECAIQLICQHQNIPAPADISDNVPSCFLCHYLNGQLDLGDYSLLIDDLLEASGAEAATFAGEHPDAFGISFRYEPGEDILGLVYLALKALDARKAAGTYYTPVSVVRRLIADIQASDNGFAGKQILDPCCGTGNFLLQLPPECVFENIYGNDIDPVSVRLARINMALKYHPCNMADVYRHITQTDYLLSPSLTKYDVIIGNPPWGYAFSESEISRLQNHFLSAVNKNAESYDVFVEQALRQLKADGTLAFVLPEAFLNVQIHTPIRRLILNTASIQTLEYLGNAFDGVQCPCIILQLTYTGKPLSCVGMRVKTNEGAFIIRTERVVSPDCFSFTTTDDEYRVLKKILGHVPGTTLSGNADFALGIVTGNNKKFLSSVKTAENEPILKGSDIFKYKAGNAKNYIVFDPDAFQQTAPAQYYRAPEKLLYRFISNQLVFAYDDRQTLSLNSCNLLIPHIAALDMKYVLAILNSRVAQFVFRKQFCSVKVLRSHIEQIVLPVISREEQQKYIGYVDQLIKEQDPATLDILYDVLDAKIATLFHLSDEEYGMIKQSLQDQKRFLS
ncbi:MAG: N-6 DNA methylase [Lachnospiraceae bacterium]|nr:N-6 DNA methylase [Lachnospiraceae bacterium]